MILSFTFKIHIKGKVKDIQLFLISTQICNIALILAYFFQQYFLRSLQSKAYLMSPLGLAGLLKTCLPSFYIRPFLFSHEYI